MSQRDSGYERKERDLYETPEWVTEALLPHIPAVDWIYEPACGSGKMAKVLERQARVIASDIEPSYQDALTSDFLAFGASRGVDCISFENHVGIITNPPYELATEFCEHALRLMDPVRGFVAMLLRTDFDHAKTRSHLFRDCPAFAKKLVLTKRIKWFADSKGQPSFNHAWFIWDWKHEGAPTLAYGP